jgi:hypothetical protein
MTRIGTSGATHQTCSKAGIPRLSGRAQIEQDRFDPASAQPFEPIHEPRRAFDDEGAVSDIGKRLAN